MTAGVAAQEPLWGVQHAGACSLRPAMEVMDRDAANGESDAYRLAGLHRILRNPCRVVVSADGGRTWQPAGEDGP